MVGIGVSCGLLGLLLSQLDWPLFIAEMKKARLTPVPLIILITCFSVWLRAVRWRWLLPTGISVSTLKLFSALSIGSLASSILPLRAGEFIRPWVLARSGKVTFSCALSSIVTERVFDVLAMLVLFYLSIAKIDNPPSWAVIFARSLAGLSGGILVVMLVAYFRGEFVISLFSKLLGVLPTKQAKLKEKLLEFAREGIAGLRAISSARELALVLASSMAIWVCYTITLLQTFACFDLPPSLAAFTTPATVGSILPDFNLFWVANTTNVFVALAVAAPSAPGFFGTFHAGCVAALVSVYHAPEEFAAALSVLAHSLQFMLFIALGFIMLQVEGLRFRQISARESITES